MLDEAFGLMEVKTEDSDKEVDCLGCRRSRSRGREFLHSGELVAWGTGGRRGLWCKDCHTVWRSCFSTSHSLVLFGRWLKVGANLTTFTMYLIGFVSLVYERV